jgi:phospholipid/cholesterol/gamma-HCH transport system ATP-binding protein
MCAHMQNPIVEIEKLTSGYNEHDILKNISLDIFENEITVILGKSGCGKTTLLKHMIGLMKPREGKIRIFDNNMIGIDEADYNSLMRKVGVLFQGGALLNSITIADNVAIPLEQHTDLPRNIIEQIVALKLELVGLSGAGKLLPSQLSGGMRKRAALARAIGLDPALLFADEPTAGLDPVTAASLDRLLMSLREQLGMSLVIVTHELASIRRVADRIVYLESGNVLFSGTLEQAERSNIKEVEEFFMPETFNM